MKVQNTFDVFRRVALQQIINTTNIEINSDHILNKITEYIQYGNQELISLTDLYEPIYNRLYLSDLMSKYLLAFMEMYTQYIINAANADTIIALSNVSYSKYLYAINKYKELESLLKKSEYLKEFKYVNHINFSIIKNVVNNINSSILVDGMPQLSYSDLLSLPLLKSEIVYPEYTTAYIDDRFTSEIEYENDNNRSINAIIRRKNSQFIGTITGKEYISTGINDNDNIKFSGLINGYISEQLFFKIYSVLYDEDNNISNILYSTSIDGKVWDFTGITDDLIVGKEYDIFALDGMLTGLTFSFSSLDNILQDKTWIINIKFSKILDSTINVKSIFNITRPISYVKYDDISEYKLKLKPEAVISLNERNNSKEIIPTLTNSTTTIVPVNKSFYSLNFGGIQNRYTISSDINNKMEMVYNFNIDNIIGYSNQYYRTGNITFDRMPVENISTIIVDAEFALPNKTTGHGINSSVILYSIIAKNDYGSVEIPLIHMYSSNFVNSGTETFVQIEEPIIQTQFVTADSSGILTYDTKFVYNSGLCPTSKLYVFNPYFEINLNEIQDYASINSAVKYKTTLMIDTSKFINSHFILSNIVKINPMRYIVKGLNDGDIWTKTLNNCVYMYYLDYDGCIKTAIKMIDKNNELIPFTGELFGKVTMYSAGENFTSPYLQNITFGAI